MNNFYKKAAAREGFTLVELIVVIAILAILAAVAYPAYTGYIAKANEAADLQILSSVATAGQGVAVQEGGKADTIEVSVSATGTKYYINTITVKYTKTGEKESTPLNKEADLKLLLLGDSGAAYSQLGELKSAKYGKDAKTITWTNGTDGGKWDVVAATGAGG